MTSTEYSIAKLSADEAAALIQDGETIGFSGFTPAGAAKEIPEAIARRARAEHEAGRPFKVGVVTGASTGDSLDGELARADAIRFRTPYQSNPDLRKAINAGRTRFFDMHLSMLPQAVRYGFLGKIDWAVVEASDVTDDGEIVLTTSVGASNTFLHKAEKILIELNRYHPRELRGIHDIYEPMDPPYRKEIPIRGASERAGEAVVKVSPRKIVGVIETQRPDEVGQFKPLDPVTEKIGANVSEFLANEIKHGIIPSTFLPIQSGVGNIANAVLGALGGNPDIPAFEMYTEVIQDSVIQLIKEGRCKFASSTSLTVSPEKLKEFYDHLSFFKSKVMLRPQEISNSPEVVRRLGVISINTAIEADIFGNINSTHIMGSNMMNGIGGSGDFTRNAFLSIFTCPSVAKGGQISAIVPQVSHMDHSEHSVGVLITEQGVADLRGKDPHERAKTIIENCAHPDYVDMLMSYCNRAKDGHTPQTLAKAFAMHQQFLETGSMREVEF